jgi:methyltransferase (TIGR00027 family)
MTELASIRPASRTAIMAAQRRALHQKYGQDPRVLDDPVAVRLLGPDFDEADDPALAPTCAPVVLRSRWSEDCLAAAVKRGVEQYVVLGAGFDSFAYRQPPWARQLRIFEIDHHASQADKRRRLADAGAPLPANLEFAPIDFERTTLRDGLRQSTLDFRRPTFFSCLGVMVYLTAESVMDIFRLVAEFPKGSEIACTFLAEELPSEITDIARAVGEPFLSHFPPEALAKDLRALGFAEVTQMSREDADRRYFYGRSDGLRAPEWPAMVTAVVG